MSIETAHATHEKLSFSDQIRQMEVVGFIGQNEQLVLDVSQKMETALERFDFLPVRVSRYLSSRGSKATVAIS